jgi:hypothetical protein
MPDRFTDFLKRYNLGDAPKVGGAPAMDSVERRIVALAADLAEYMPPDEEPTGGK